MPPEPSPDTKQGTAAQVAKPYELEPARDKTRARMAICLFWLLAFEVLAAIVMPITLARYVPHFLDPSQNKGEVQEKVGKVNELFDKLFSLIFGPTVALFGAATGFYFGTKSDPPKKMLLKNKGFSAA